MRPARNRQRVLVVDDEPAIRRAWGVALQLAGYDVSEAWDGLAALEQVEKGQDAIILDLQIPKLDGFKVLEQLKARPETASIPVMVVTAMWIDRVPQAAALVRKPCGVLHVVDTLARILP